MILFNSESMQTGDTRVSGPGTGLTPSPVPFLPGVRGDVEKENE